MNTLEMARAAGFVILLDGKIGRETYCSVTGSLLALERFQALCGGEGCETRKACDDALVRGSANSGSRRAVAVGPTEGSGVLAVDKHDSRAESCENLSPAERCEP